MAGEWIKMRTNLWDDPRVSQLCDLTDQAEAAVVGGLYWIWATADEHSSDGLLAGMTLRAIDRKTGLPGLGNAMVTVGWLIDNGDSVTVSRFDEHNGASAKQRAQTAKRVATHKGNAKVTQAALPESEQTVTDALPREEKIREEEEKPTSKAEAPAAVEPPQRRATDASASRLPADWSPTYDDIEFCKTNRPDLVPNEVAARFRDYWIAQPGAKGKKTDWPATWRNWVRNEKQQARASPRQAQQANTSRLLDRINGTRSHEPDPRIIDIN